MQDEALSWIQVLKLFLAMVLGAGASAIPLWFKIKKLSQQLTAGGIKLKGQAAQSDLKADAAREEVEQQKKINSEAEWKRIIEFRDAELIRLRDRDDQQEKQLLELWNKHIECQKSEAAQAERIKAQADRITASEDRIKSMEKQLGELLAAVITKGKGT